MGPGASRSGAYMPSAQCEEPINSRASVFWALKALEDEGGERRGSPWTRERNTMVPATRLLAACLLATAWYFTATEGVVLYTCHNDTAELECEVGSKIQLHHILYKVGVGTRCGEGKRHPEDGPGIFCTFPWAEMVVEDL
ncbi:hypothetical protein NHX12_028398 [Muraenolepis orangiensis]|uniref:Uncharacterized protein n=1 Tax=Muraenolepis orangiensis TaxID=630683 RepID=A0A9Q0EC29_9TELE|nr:hypothetical protein NHX12_028398 [Muraenolepis orangiensis]